ncbi:hypothetical protein B0H19DRAFT_511754 [Mycena capillaripes]|nr:hypothetical protein B0H19DRAFT_511754 [Mycena capillaripes]
MAFQPFDPDTLQEGPVAAKKGGIFTSWRGWTNKYIVLRPRSLTIYKNRVSGVNLSCLLLTRRQSAPESGVRISLNSITRVERTHSSRKDHCLLLDAAGTRYFFAFRSDSELYEWHDKIYNISPLMLFIAGDSTEIDLDDIIQNYSSSGDSPVPSSRPSTPRTLPRKMSDPRLPLPLYRPHTHSPASSRQFLLDLDDLRGQKAPPVQHLPTSSKSNVGLRPGDRELIRKAVSLLCNLMEPRLLRKSEPGGEKPFDQVEIRLRSLSRLKRKWGKHELGDVPDTEEMQTFAEALRDGYVLCQLLNTLHSSPVVRPDARGQDDSSLNITKFLAACIAHGFPSSELFLPLDLVEASGYSLARVAGTIIALAQSFDSSQSAAPKSNRAQTPVDDHLPAIQRATDDLEEWVENFIALTRQKMISDQLEGGDNLAGIVEPDVEFVRVLLSFTRTVLTRTTVKQQGAGLLLSLFYPS